MRRFQAPFYCRIAGWLLLAVLTLGAGPVLAQVPVVTGTPVQPVATADSARALVQPLPAFFRSLLLPGWGQAVLDRKLTAGLFLLWEGVTLGMTLKIASEVRYLAATDSTRALPEGITESPLLRAKKAQREDWIVLLAFNHLFSGLEAYVSAHLWDFPGDLHFQMLPGRTGPRPGIGWRLPLTIP